VKHLNRKIAWTSASIHALVHASVLVLPTLLTTFQRAFGVSLLEMSAAANAAILAYGLAAIPAGALADRYGSRAVMTGATLTTTASLFGVAAAPSFSWLVAGLIGLGLSAGAYHPSGLSLLTRTVTASEQGRAIGIHGLGGTLGAALAPIVAWVGAQTLGWRQGFALAGFVAFFCSALAFRLPQSPTANGVGAPKLTGGGSSSQRPAVLNTARLVIQRFTALWSQPPLRWLMLFMMAGGLVYQGVITFLPLHLAERAGGDLNAATLTTLVLLAGAIAQRLGGQLADQLPRERLFLAEMLLFAPVMFLLGLTSGLGLIVMALSFGFLFFMSEPLAAALTAAHAEQGDHGFLFGLQIALTFGVGSFAASLGGLLITLGGTEAAFLGFAAVALVQLGAAVALVWTTRTRTFGTSAEPQNSQGTAKALS